VRAAWAPRLQAHLDAHLTLSFFRHLLALPLRFFEQRTSGDLLTRLESNGALRDALMSHLITALLDGALVTGYLLLLLALAPAMGLLVCAAALLLLLLLAAAGPPMRRLTQRSLLAQADLESASVEVLQGIATLKASGAEPWALEGWARRFFADTGLALRRSQLVALVSAGQILCHTLTPLALLWIGAGMVFDGRISVGAMLGLTLLGAACLAPLASLTASLQALQLAAAHLERLADVLETAPEQAAGPDEPPLPEGKHRQIQGRVELRGVSFRYDPQGPLALQDLSLAIAPGQRVAIVGPTGSGKSTLVRLLLGLYPPSDGIILYDGRPIQTLDHGWLRRQIGVVLQEVALFSGSIRENIIFHRPGISQAQVERAARLAAIHDQIAQLPLGYDTRLDSGGTRLSGGMRQRLVLARALVHAPALLLLDEATSHLDSRTERAIDRNLRSVGCSCLVVAHRLSTVRGADLIIVLEQGRAVERGTHAELLALGASYAELTRDQGDE
jgi:ATP-binding cassette, subfamily B, bacterial